MADAAGPYIAIGLVVVALLIGWAIEKIDLGDIDTDDWGDSKW